MKKNKINRFHVGDKVMFDTIGHKNIIGKVIYVGANSITARGEGYIYEFDKSDIKDYKIHLL